MVNMDRIDVKYDKVKLFGKITSQTPKSVTMDVKYPEDFEGTITMKPSEIDAISHGVYVPIEYRSKKKSKSPKRKTKNKDCGCS